MITSAIILGVIAVGALYAAKKHIESTPTGVEKIAHLKNQVAEAEASIVDLVNTEVAELRDWADFLAKKHDDLLSVDHASVPTADLKAARDALAALAVPA